MKLSIYLSIHTSVHLYQKTKKNKSEIMGWTRRMNNVTMTTDDQRQNILLLLVNQYNWSVYNFNSYNSSCLPLKSMSNKIKVNLSISVLAIYIFN